MAIRLREVDGVPVALCAAETDEKLGDYYLDDAVHHALSAKFAHDWQGATVDWVYDERWAAMASQKVRDAKEILEGTMNIQPARQVVRHCTRCAGTGLIAVKVSAHQRRLLEALGDGQWWAAMELPRYSEFGKSAQGMALAKLAELGLTERWAQIDESGRYYLSRITERGLMLLRGLADA